MPVFLVAVLLVAALAAGFAGLLEFVLVVDADLVVAAGLGRTCESFSSEAMPVT